MEGRLHVYRATKDVSLQKQGGVLRFVHSPWPNGDWLRIHDTADMINGVIFTSYKIM